GLRSNGKVTKGCTRGALLGVYTNNGARPPEQPPRSKGEFGNMCAMSLAMSKDAQTDCSINGQYLGKTYCFGSTEAMTQFMQNPKDNLAKAQAYYSKKHG